MGSHLRAQAEQDALPYPRSLSPHEALAPFILPPFALGMPPPHPSRSDLLEHEPFLRSLMRRQLALSISCAATFLLALLLLPLANYFFPEAMATRVAGFTLTWLILGLLIFPFIWVISWVFIRRSIALEDEEIAEAQKERLS